MPGLIEIAKTDDILRGQMFLYKVEGKDILIINNDGRYYAIDGKCSHMGGDLSRGLLENSVIRCPRHGSKFDITNGKCIEGPKIGPFKIRSKDISSYELIVDNNVIKIKL